MVEYVRENSGYASDNSGNNNYGSNSGNYAVVGYANASSSGNSSIAEQLSFLCRGTCGTEMGCSCGRSKRS